MFEFVKASKVLGRTQVIGAGVGCTGTFITAGAFQTELEAVNCQKYLKTKFARALLSINKITQHNPPDCFRFIPNQDFTADSDIDWSKSIANIDRQLFTKYGLDWEQILFIETFIADSG